MMKGLGFDESMSNLTSTISGETSISSNARNNDQSSSPTTATATVNAATNTILYPQASSSSFASPHEPPQLQPSKKKRGLPGNPDPDAEVIALSPKSLLATNRFICEICNKGFQRDQNLQLHRRGHNLPWKLKQRAKDQIIRKKVYVCPEPSCVHHDPSRALGDLTGVKKHFSRKHGEKKWKCDKCSKKYAVKSDWKAHSKICGTKEYRCDCGTLFSRRDSFITHRAFCDALAEESARAINPLINTFHPLVSNQTNTSHSNVLSHLTLPSHLTSQLLQSSLPLKQEQPDHHYHHHNHHSNSNFISSRSDIPPWLACPPPPPQQQEMVGGGAQYQLDNNQPSSHMYTFQQHQQSHEFEQQCSSNNNRNSNSNSNAIMGPTLSSFHAPMNPQMSATALLQKAAEMGVTVSTNHSHPQLNNHHQHQLVLPNSTSCGLTVDPRYLEQGQVAPPTEGVLPGGGGGGGRQQSSILHDVMLLSSFQSTPQPAVSGSGFNNSNFEDFHHAMTATKSQLNCGSGGGGGGGGGGGSGGGGNDGLTRDFLGLRTFPHKDFGNMARLGGHHMNTSSNSLEQKHDIHQNQTPW